MQNPFNIFQTTFITLNLATKHSATIELGNRVLKTSLRNLVLSKSSKKHMRTLPKLSAQSKIINYAFLDCKSKEM